MAGTLEVPVEGNANSTEDPKVKAGIKRLNELLEGSNLVAEAGLGAGSVGAAKLATGAKELFVQLAVAAGVKLAFGSTKMTWTAAKSPAPVVIEHGLGKEPKIVLPVVNLGSASSAFINAGTYTATKFTLNGFSSEVLSITLEVPWLAIG